MTPQIKKFTEKLLQDLRKSPDVPAHSAIQAVLLGSIKLNLKLEECREVLDILRMEFGMDRQRWSGLIVTLLRSMPEEFRTENQKRIIIP